MKDLSHIESIPFGFSLFLPARISLTNNDVHTGYDAFLSCFSAGRIVLEDLSF